VKHIYVAGPYSQGDVAQNIRKAALMGLVLGKLGYIPFIPHLYHFVHILDPQLPDFWMSLDLAWLSKCDAMLVLPGESIGVKVEEEYAEDFGIPIYYDVGDLQKEVKP
jgi:hypothetical protein